jgi:hypothetical protein
MWFRDFLSAHNKLLKLQVGIQRTIPLMEHAMKKLSRGDRVYFEVVKRHIGSHKISEKELRIIRIYQDDITRICTDPVDDFLWTIEYGDIISRARNIIASKNTNNRHFADYFLHSYDIIKKYRNLGKTLDMVIAFDAVTNALHHSFAACVQVARYHPIAGNVMSDASMMNNIIRFDVMSGDVTVGMERLSGYINGDITPKILTDWY